MDKDKIVPNEKENFLEDFKSKAALFLEDRAKDDTYPAFSKLMIPDCIELAKLYGEQATQHLREIVKTDEIVYQKILETINNIENYDKITEVKRFETGISHVLGLVTMTSELPHTRIIGLSDFLDEDKCNFFPICKLKFGVRERLLELCMVCLGIYRESESYLTILLANLYGKWEVEAPVSRTSKRFIA